jgi:hypothetical protein
VASTIKIKRSSVAGKVPTISDITIGELAINTKDQKLYSSNGTAVFQIGGSSGGGTGSYANASITKSQVKNLTQNDYVVTDVTGAFVSLASSYLQVANAVVTYQTKAVERAALANTNSYIAAQATRITLVNTNLLGTNTAIRALDAQKLSVSNATTLLAAKATWTGLTGTNTALRTLISDRLQVANASSIYQTKAVERAALANTNSYIATKASTGKAIAMAIVFGG